MLLYFKIYILICAFKYDNYDVTHIAPQINNFYHHYHYCFLFIIYFIYYSYEYADAYLLIP